MAGVAQERKACDNLDKSMRTSRRPTNQPILSDEVIQRSDEILGGTPVFRGTRVPVQALLDYLEAGDRLDDFMRDFPSVRREQAIRVLDRFRELVLR